MKLLNTFRYLFHRNARTIRKPRPQPARPKICLGVEALETRNLMASGLAATFYADTGVLQIIGTEQADSVRVTDNGARVSIANTPISVIQGGVTRTVSSLVRTRITEIDISTLGGDDVVSIQDTKVAASRALRVKIEGGAGDDVLTGGAAADTIVGGLGDDRISGGRAGDDDLYGGTGLEDLDGTETAAELDQDHHLFYGSELDNYFGLNEKWFAGSGFLEFYYLTPDGALYQPDGNQVASLSPSFYDDPSLLAEADSGTRAYHLVRDLQLTSYVPEADNMDGLDERWFQSDSGQTYFITSDGNLHHYESGGWFSPLVAPVVATLDQSYWADPNKLVNAQSLLGEMRDNDTITGGVGNDTIQAGLGDDVVDGSAGDDLIFGMSGHDRIDGDFAGARATTSGSDTIVGGSGNDTLMGNRGPDLIYGGTGDDDVDGGDDFDNIYGGAGNDTLRGGNAGDYLHGDDGDDALYGNAGFDSIWGGSGNDYLVGDDARSISGFVPSGDDRLYGEDGWDTLKGGAGQDQLSGGDDSDYLYGDQGNDIILGDDGYDFAWGGTGNDTIQGGDGGDELHGDADNDLIDAGVGNDFVWGGAGDDTIRGGEGTDVLRGEAGNDALYGNGGTDWLFGDEGNDGLFGGWGDGVDYLTGGTGADRFLMSSFNIVLAKLDEDVVAELFAEDAQLNFLNGEKNWTDDEIIAIDAGLQWLHKTTNNTRLLELQDGRSMNIFRYQSLGEYDADNTGGVIRVADSAFSANTADETMVHELAHNWDWSEMIGAQAKNAWSDLSAWRIHDLQRDPVPAGFRQGGGFGTNPTRYVWIYRDDAGFARDYGRTNPNEDFATCVEMYYALTKPSTATSLNPAANWQAKWNFVDSWLQSLKS